MFALIRCDECEENLFHTAQLRRALFVFAVIRASALRD